MLVPMQSLAGINVCTTVRMTVVKLKTGGLWVHAPIAPTRQGFLRVYGNALKLPCRNS